MTIRIPFRRRDHGPGGVIGVDGVDQGIADVQEIDFVVGNGHVDSGAGDGDGENITGDDRSRDGDRIDLGHIEGGVERHLVDIARLHRAGEGQGIDLGDAGGVVGGGNGICRVGPAGAAVGRGLGKGEGEAGSIRGQQNFAVSGPGGSGDQSQIGDLGMIDPGLGDAVDVALRQLHGTAFLIEGIRRRIDAGEAFDGFVFGCAVFLDRLKKNNGNIAVYVGKRPNVHRLVGKKKSRLGFGCFLPRGVAPLDDFRNVFQ